MNRRILRRMAGLTVLLTLLFGLRTIEMITAHLQPMLMGHLDIAFISFVDAVASLSSLQVDVTHVGIAPHCFPKDFALIMAHVNAVDVGTGILALHIRSRLGEEGQRHQNE